MLHLQFYYHTRKLWLHQAALGTILFNVTNGYKSAAQRAVLKLMSSKKEDIEHSTARTYFYDTAYTPYRLSGRIPVE